MRCLGRGRKATEGSALLEFAIVLPLLVVFIVGIYDFSGAYNQKQKIEHAALAGWLSLPDNPPGDRDPSNSNPTNATGSERTFNSLAADGAASSEPGKLQGKRGRSHQQPTDGPTNFDCAVPLTDPLTMVIDRGVVGRITVNASPGDCQLSYHWRFNSVINC
jgi:Flp pilus assembly protein TadG